MPYKNEPKNKKYTSNIYSHAVLDGNWFERRLEYHLDRQAITPSITGRSDCMNHLSTYKADYVRKMPEYEPCTVYYNDEADEIKLSAYRNEIKGTTGNINLYDSDKFLNNIVTTMDIAYNILRKKWDVSLMPVMKDSEPKEPREPKEPKKSEKKADVFGVYGNATKTGLLAWKKCQSQKVERRDMSVMKTDYVPLPIKPIVIVKGRK